MAISFIKTKKRQQYLMLVFVIVIIVTAIIVWQGFLKEKFFPSGGIKELPSESGQEIDIDFTILEDPLLREFQFFEESFNIEELDLSILEASALQEFKSFEGISPFEEKPGRENPFIHY